jgi:hypothetical protein
MGKFVQLILAFANISLFPALIGAFGDRFTTPWDGPAIVKVVLAAATLVLGAVAVGVALLAVWGYTTLREHAANVAKETAAKTASETADSTATRVINAWLDRFEPPRQPDSRPNEESIADAYKGEGQ